MDAFRFGRWNKNRCTVCLVYKKYKSMNMCTLIFSINQPYIQQGMLFPHWLSPREVSLRVDSVNPKLAQQPLVTLKYLVKIQGRVRLHVKYECVVGLHGDSMEKAGNNYLIRISPPIRNLIKNKSRIYVNRGFICGRFKIYICKNQRQTILCYSPCNGLSVNDCSNLTDNQKISYMIIRYILW